MLTGHHLHAADGSDVGEVTDVLGGEDMETPPRWLAVKTGWFSERLVPYEIVEQRADGELITSATSEAIKHAPKVPVHVEPSGSSLDELRNHYSLT